MTEIISVRFKNGGKEYFFNPNGVKVEEGQMVIIETAKGVECATCTRGNTMIDETQLLSPLRPMLRIATSGDLRQLEENKRREQQAFQVCQEKIAQHKLEMKLINVEYSFDGSKILFFFTAEDRVDFRSLVKDLAAVFRTRIELRQVGVRDEAKMLGGLGVCGRPYCCSSFLNDFHPVSIKMAKTQNLSLNPTKISGACGRLMCCLQYEQDAYTDLIRRAPKQDSLVETPDGVGTVCQVNLLRESSKVILDNNPDEPRCYANCDLCVIRNGKGKRPEGYEKPENPKNAPKQERRERVLLDEPPKTEEKSGQSGEEHRPRRSKKPRPQEGNPRTEKDTQGKDQPQQESQPKGAQQNGEQRPRRPRRHRSGRGKNGENSQNQNQNQPE